MKVIVERDDFAEAIGAATRAIDHGTAIPVLKNILLKPNGRALGIAGTNMAQQLETSVAADIDENSDGMVLTVIGDALCGIVNQLPKGCQVRLEWGADGRDATLHSGRSRYKLNALPASDYPALMSPAEPIAFTLPAVEFARALSSIKFAMGKDKSRLWLHGVNLAPGDDENPCFGSRKGARMVLTTCNNYELGRASLELPDGAEQCPSIILPDISVNELIRICADDESDLDIAVTASLARFTLGDTSFTTKLIDQQWVDLSRQYPTEVARQMTIDCESLRIALSRLRAIGNDAMAAEFMDGKATFKVKSQEVGAAEEEIEVDWQGEPLIIGLRLGGVLGILDAIKTECCAMKFTDAMHSVVVQPLRGGIVDGDRTYITMPMRV